MARLSKLTAPAGQTGLIYVRAEIVSSSEFVLVVDGVRSYAVQETILSSLERAATAVGLLVRERLGESDRCELDAAWYRQIDTSLSAAGYDKVGGAFVWVGLPAWVVAALPQFSGVDIHDDVPTTVFLPEGLMPYQEAGVRRAVVQGGRVLLADEMGLGKTAQALAIIAQYLDAEGPALVVTPSSLGGVWKEQTRRWLPQLLTSEVQLIRGMQDLPLPTARIVIVSYAIFVRSAARLSKRLHGDPWKILVCDEAHYLKNPASQRGMTLLPMLQACNRAVLVTGTPTPKQASEAYSLLHALRPMQCPFKEWCDRYGAGQTERREAEVAALLSEVMIRRMKTEVLNQLPEKIRQRICLLPAGKTGAMKKLQQEAQEGSRVSDEQHFKQLSELKQVAAQDYVEYLLDACDTKFLLFGHHHSMLDALEKTIVKRRVGYIRIDGSVPAAERAGLVHNFQVELSCRVAILAVTAAGEGLTLTAASICVFCELCPAVPGVVEQAEARVHRIGQTASRIDVHFLIVDGTRDEHVFARLESRGDAVARAVGDSTRREEQDPLSYLQDIFQDAPSVREADSITKFTEGRNAAPAKTRGPPSAPLKKKRKPSTSLEAMLDTGINQMQAEFRDAPLTDATTEEYAQVWQVTPQVADGDHREVGSHRAVPAQKKRKPRQRRCKGALQADENSSQDDEPIAKLISQKEPQRFACDSMLLVPGAIDEDELPIGQLDPRTGRNDHGQVAAAAVADEAAAEKAPATPASPEQIEEVPATKRGPDTGDTVPESRLSQSHKPSPAPRAMRGMRSRYIDRDVTEEEEEMDAALSFFTSGSTSGTCSLAPQIKLSTSCDLAPPAGQEARGTTDEGNIVEPVRETPGSTDDPLSSLLDNLIDAARAEQKQ